MSNGRKISKKSFWSNFEAEEEMKLFGIIRLALLLITLIFFLILKNLFPLLKYRKQSHKQTNKYTKAFIALCKYIKVLLTHCKPRTSLIIIYKLYRQSTD